MLAFFFFFNDTATTEIYTLSLHDALPISELGGDPATQARLRLDGDDARDHGHPAVVGAGWPALRLPRQGARRPAARAGGDRKSTRLNSSHANISYAVFCLKKKKKS